MERNVSLNKQDAAEHSAFTTHIFVLPQLLPNSQLLLDIHVHMVFLFCIKRTAIWLLSPSYRLTPSAARVFLVLLQAYPDYCSYRSLFQALYPPGQEQHDHHIWQKDLILRPIRRALLALAPALRGLGLRVVSLRGQGYVLASQQVTRSSETK